MTVTALRRLTLAMLVASGGPLLAAPPVVHEWGTFTTVAGEDGVALEWRPLAVDEDLPAFVHRGLDEGLRGTMPRKGEMSGTVRMETPVIYFYADEEMDVSVQVQFTGGTITEWYPRAQWVGAGVNWGRLHLIPDPAGAIPLPREESPSPYYAARGTDAAVVRLCGEGAPEHEKFLFYRGVGTFPLPLDVTLEGGEVVIVNREQDAVAEVILFESRDGRVGFHTDRLVVDAVRMDCPELTSDVELVSQELVRALVGQGLYAREAEAMVATWRTSWFEDGLRVFYLLPRSVTDALLPLAMTPEPSELVRVMVGRIELVTPELEATVRGLATGLLSDDPAARDAARRGLAAIGRFAEPVCKRLLASETDPGVRKGLAECIRPPSTP